ncbi:MAG: hypothetical protein SOV61_02135 [Lachnospiraceae bacterium]|nr:hypothetical protein [Lachnospiraceae bacterium]
MKKIFRDTCILASLMILIVFAFSIIWAGITQEIMLVFQLFGLAFIYVAIVFVLAYFLELSVTKKDIDYINEKIKKRRIQ